MLSKSMVTLLLLITLALVTSACGAIATPRPPGPSTPEPFTLAPRDSSGEGAAVSQRPTDIPPTATPTDVPPTSTPTEVPPTATATSTPLPEPTEAPVAVGDPALGEEIFRNGKETAPPCVTCHMVEQDAVLVGPSLVGIAARAGERVPDQSAEEYLRLSIIEPSAYLVPNTDINVFTAGETSLMFQQYADLLSEEDIDHLVAYMLTLE